MKFVPLFLAVTLSAVAADTPPPMSRLFIADVPADSAAEFYAVQRETADIYKANKAPIPRYAWTSLTGDPRLVTVIPLASLTQLGEPTWLSGQGDEQSRQARSSRLGRSVGDRTSRIVTQVTDLTWDPTPNGAPEAFAIVRTYNIKPGTVPDFMALIKQSNDAIKKVGKARSIYTSRVSYGGDMYEFYVVVGYDSLADSTGGDSMRTVMGEAAYTAYFKKSGEIVNTVRRDIMRYRPEFSYVPAK